MIRHVLQFAFIVTAIPLLGLAAGYREDVSGDLSNDRLAPSSIALVGGDNRIAGTVILGDRDYFTVQVPSGLALSSILLEQYDSSNGRAFLGVQSGTFTVDPDLAAPSDLLGYTHFGLDNLIGEDLLDNLGAGLGAIGFAPPLGPGDYSFWVNQTEPSLTGYQFNFVLVPEPGSAMPFGAAGLTLCARRRRR